MFKYCDECDKEHLSEELIVPKTVKVQGKEINVELTKLICKECGNEVSDESYMNTQLKKIHDTYVDLYGIPVDEIRNVRIQFKGLGLRPFAKILGIGSASVSRHEAGDLPSDKHVAIYRELQEEPRRIFEYFSNNKHELSPRELKKTEEILNAWQLEQGGKNEQYVEFMQDDEEIIESIYKPFERTQLSGYLPFNLEKFVNMVLYFTNNGGVNKTKLMKLLWYADFLKFKRHTTSMSGAVYTRFPFGPVPKDHEITIAHLKHMDVIDIEETLINDEGWTKMTVRANQEFDPSLFSPAEIGILEEVKSVFRDFGSRRISDYSHEELAWKETREEQPIDYKYAKDLREFDLV
ncbi:hypothetical protein GCM10008018_36300 [Paenibacillus marchantiophytorum]|uniref:Antitoxin SocA-like Panacea domain-containing protein n=1 Tax=Paenibacillus marchantiophytorum TaxID=1619310 RepID=A0ABQ1EV88_9BACL|nr:type II TA system antitoxin MqsA family protein [Paenibacillus marchantiophytorum]GFZ86933.1 hypothetical protein GCM10008018_36300 [Paenibacillus marchantiophytorum]